MSLWRGGGTCLFSNMQVWGEGLQEADLEGVGSGKNWKTASGDGVDGGECPKRVPLTLAEDAGNVWI